jgi:hypothetical protein
MAPLSKTYFSTNRQLELTNLLAFAGVGIIIKLVFGSAQPASAVIWGYGLSSMALFLLMMISLALANIEEMRAGISKFFEAFTQYALPTLLLLILLAWLIAINVNFFDLINSKKVPEEFNFYSFLSSVVILLQTFVLFMFYDQKFKITNLQQSSLKSQSEEESATKNSTLSYIFTLINAILIGMMQIVLTFFTTDG